MSLRKLLECPPCCNQPEFQVLQNTTVSMTTLDEYTALLSNPKVVKSLLAKLKGTPDEELALLYSWLQLVDQFPQAVHGWYPQSVDFKEDACVPAIPLTHRMQSAITEAHNESVCNYINPSVVAVGDRVSNPPWSHDFTTLYNNNLNRIRSASQAVGKVLVNGQHKGTCFRTNMEIEGHRYTDTVITARHVIIGREPSQVQVEYENWGRFHVTEIFEATDIDCAVIRLDRLNPRIPCTKFGTLQMGQLPPCVVIGYPLIPHHLPRLDLAMFPEYETKHGHKRHAVGRTTSSFGDSMFHNCNTEGGSSGSPVLTFNGEVVAVHTGYGVKEMKNVSTWYFAVNRSRTWIKSVNCELQKNSGPPPKKPRNQTVRQRRSQHPAQPYQQVDDPEEKHKLREWVEKVCARLSNFLAMLSRGVGIVVEAVVDAAKSFWEFLVRLFG